MIERAFYAPMHDRERIAAVINCVADLVLTEVERDVPNDLTSVRWAEQQCIARLLRQYAHELIAADRDD